MNDPTTLRKKLEPKWKGPYRIISVDMDGVIYSVLNLRDEKAGLKVLHYDRLKPYRSSWNIQTNQSTGNGQNGGRGTRSKTNIYIFIRVSSFDGTST